MKLILKHLPKSHDIIDLVDFEGISRDDLTVEKVSKKVQLEMTVLFVRKGEDCKKWLVLYTIASVLCYLMDGLQFCIQYRAFGVKGKEHAELLMLLATLIYFAVDFYYFVWVLQLKQKLPASMASFVSDAIFGYTGKMARELKGMLSREDQGKVNDK